MLSNDPIVAVSSTAGGQVAVAPDAAYLLLRSTQRSMVQPTREHRQRGSRSLSRFVAGINDAMLLLIVVLLFPLVIVLIGAPIALVARIIIEIAHRL
jgi:hypothetical protein